jgi:hypothetical protein
MRQSFVTAAVVLSAPMAMAAASIEGSPVRDAIRAPFEELGLVPSETGRGDPAPESAAERAGSEGGEATRARPSADRPSAAHADVPTGQADNRTTTAPAAPEDAQPVPQTDASLPAAPPADPVAEPTVQPEPEAADPPPTSPLDEISGVIDDATEDPLGFVPELGNGP